MLLSNLIDSIAQKTGNQNDYGFKEMLKSDILSARATLIKQEYEKSKFVNDVLIQTIKCVPLIKVNASQCQIAIDFGSVLRTKNKVPKPLLVKDATLFVSITTPFINNKRISITLVKPEEIEFLKYRKFTNNSIYATWENEYIYIHNTLNLPSISIRNIFANPFEVKEFANQANEEKQCCCEDCEDCKDEDSTKDCNTNDKDTCFENDDLIIDETLISGIKSFLYQELRYYNKEENNSEIQINK